jgi:hypothetical protein
MNNLCTSSFRQYGVGDICTRAASITRNTDVRLSHSKQLSSQTQSQVIRCAWFCVPTAQHWHRGIDFVWNRLLRTCNEDCALFIRPCLVVIAMHGMPLLFAVNELVTSVSSPPPSARPEIISGTTSYACSDDSRVPLRIPCC